MTHRNAGHLKAFLDAYGAKDRDAVAELLSQNAVWHVGGTHQFSGDYRGRDAILDYFDLVARETDNTLRLEPQEIMANDQRGAAFLRVTGERSGQNLDVLMAEAFVFTPDGAIAEFWAHANDQDAIDRFWS